ncbi:P-loop containing nucleoside triphosphate hydrolase protein [Truncatella angustata]|uniref:P-loop containing nucleoside triphosphate hydrolase protein n=1 Tax=Truncatella angustata TaxID=152316 RepID=A0A9P8UXP9_9PEZI|nr:P-loop containing nucleoside triphosphate hydrolase protein [Truncatella angustata]KAH6660461.1 P-loop containing nucleoside triphosphate hydrolase protein [Truncatella angustata]
MSQPFHAGGATAIHLSEPISLLKALVTRWSELDITHLGSIVALAGVAPSAWRFARTIWTEVSGWIRRFFIASVTIPGRDPLNRNVVSWVLANVIEGRTIRFFTARTESQLGRDDGASLKKTRRHAQYLPHWETAWFWHKKNLFIVSRSLDSFNASMMDAGYDGIGGEDLTISCIGRSADPIKALVESCREYADRQAQYFVTIYSRDRYGISWQPKSRMPIRHLDTVHFDEVVKKELLADLRKYLDPKTQKRYRNRSMPYRRGYLLYGPPGTGKSSLSTALAGEFGLDLYEVKLPSVPADHDLEQMFQEIPPQCIVLLEDIDAVGIERDSGDKSDQSSIHSNRSSCTLSGVLNVLDGVGSAEGRIVIMTTNKPDQLDSALVRPGRIDMKVFLGNINQQSAKQMFVRMFSPDLDSSESPMRLEDIEKLGDDFGSRIPEDTFTPSQLQGFFQSNLDSATDAVTNVTTWVEKEIHKKSIDEGIEIVRQTPKP